MAVRNSYLFDFIALKRKEIKIWVWARFFRDKSDLRLFESFTTTNVAACDLPLCSRPTLCRLI